MSISEKTNSLRCNSLLLLHLVSPLLCVHAIDPEWRCDLERNEILGHFILVDCIRREKDERADCERRDDERKHAAGQAARHDQADALTAVGEKKQQNEKFAELTTAEG